MSRRDLLEEAVDKCLAERYRKPQPPIEWDDIIKGCKEGKYNDKNSPIYQHYLSEEEYKDIVEAYIYDYNIENPWEAYMDLLIEYLENGGTTEVYVKPEGFPGYRDYEKTPKLADVIGKENAEKTMDLVKKCKDYYNTKREENNFRFSVMNYSPSCNKEDVQKFWGDKVKICDREIDPETCEYVTVNEEQINEWKEQLEFWNECEDKDEWLINAYTKLLEKYEKGV